MALQTPSLLVPSSVWELPTTTFPRQQRKSNVYFFYNTKCRAGYTYTIIFFVWCISYKAALLPYSPKAGCKVAVGHVSLSLSLSLPTTLFWAWTLFACSISTNIIHSYRIPMHSRKKTLSGVKRSFSEELSYIACII